MTSLPEHADTLREIEQQIQEMTHWQHACDPSTSCHIAMNIRRLETERAWIETHPLTEALTVG